MKNFYEVVVGGGFRGHFCLAGGQIFSVQQFSLSVNLQLSQVGDNLIKKNVAVYHMHSHLGASTSKKIYKVSAMVFNIGTGAFLPSHISLESSEKLDNDLKIL